MSEQNKISRQHTSFKGGKIDVDMDSYLSQHDIVYLTPGTEGYEGFPIGNGDWGAMAWTPKDRLHFQINKCDTWDDGPNESFGAWDDGNRSNAYTYLRHCGQLEIESGLPLFDWIYLEDFIGRLSLADARSSWFAKSPVGEAKCSCFVARDPGVMVLSYSDRLIEPLTRKVKLARWGSRGFEHWYCAIKHDGLMGPEGTTAGCDGDEIWIVQPTRSIKFAMAAKIVSNSNSFSSKLYNSRESGFEFNEVKACSFLLYISVVTTEESEKPLSTARDIVRKAANKGEQEIFKKHKEQWANFWSKSFVDIPEKYLENLWYLNLYQIGSSSMGKYPPHFINGLWSWTRDIRPWNHYYHWNQQCYTWPLCSSGHSELLEPYARWRLEGLPHAIEDARNVHNCDGAFYSDVCNRRGYQDVIEPKDYKPTDEDEWLQCRVVPTNYNLTPGAQISHDLYRCYQYTLDEKFLKIYVYPIIRGWVEFMLDYLQKREDGLYHVPKSDPYESASVHCEDTTNTIAYVRLLFPIFANITRKLNVDLLLGEKALEVSKKTVDYIHVELSEELRSQGKVPLDSMVVASGRLVQTNEPLFYGCKALEGKYDTFTRCAQLTPIFPAGLIGLDQAETKEFEIFKNTLLMCLPVENDGHCPSLIWKARLGLRDHMEEDLKEYVDKHQFFSQGLWSYWNRYYKPILEEGKYKIRFHASDHLNANATNRVKVVGKNEYIDIPTKPFAHIGLEAGSIFETAINDMLLGGYGNTIRIFPATPLDWDAKFTLHAVGGFIISSEKQAGCVKYIAIESCSGQKCCVVNPWPRDQKYRVIDVTEKPEVILSDSLDEICFSTKCRHIYIIEMVDKPLLSFEHLKLIGVPNNNCKKLKDAILGKSRQF